MTSLGVQMPVLPGLKHEFMTEPLSTASVGVPGMWTAPTPPSPSLLAAPPQLMARL